MVPCEPKYTRNINLTFWKRAVICHLTSKIASLFNQNIVSQCTVSQCLHSYTRMRMLLLNSYYTGGETHTHTHKEKRNENNKNRFLGKKNKP